MKHSFAPFGPEEVAFLIERTGIDYSRTNFAHPDWLCVSCRDDAGPLMGLCCFEFKNWFDAYFTIAVDDSRCITRKVMRSMFTAVFAQAVRVSAEIPPDSGEAIRLAERMGFEVEGFKRLAIDGRRDALQLGMIKDTCRFLGARPRRSEAAQEGKYGQLSETS